jgi:hypothetical protein
LILPVGCRRIREPLPARLRVGAALAAALAGAACGGSQPDEPSTGKRGGAQAEEQVVDELGLDRDHADVALRLCDRRAVEAVQVDGDEAIDTWRELRGKAASRVRVVALDSPARAWSNDLVA